MPSEVQSPIAAANSAVANLQATSNVEVLQLQTLIYLLIQLTWDSRNLQAIALGLDPDAQPGAYSPPLT